MPADIVTGQDAVDVAAYVASVAGKDIEGCDPSGDSGTTTAETTTAETTTRRTSGLAGLALGFEVDDDVRDGHVVALLRAREDLLLEPVRTPRRVRRDDDLVCAERP